jgi:hypothetical protein
VWSIGSVRTIFNSCHSALILPRYSASYREPRVKLTVVFNVGVFDDTRRYLISELKAPVGWFVGGPHDAGFAFVSTIPDTLPFADSCEAQRDYEKLPKGVPALFASLDTGHLGTYAAPNAGKFGKAAVAFLDWQFRGNEESKRKFKDPQSEGSFVKDKWNITMKDI